MKKKGPVKKLYLNGKSACMTDTNSICCIIVFCCVLAKALIYFAVHCFFFFRAICNFIVFSGREKQCERKELGYARLALDKK